MSDFDDEPTEGREATEPNATGPAGAGAEAADPDAGRPPRSKPVPGDDWDDDDWDDDDDTGRSGKRDLTLVYAIVAAAIVIVIAVVLTRPKDDSNASEGNKTASTTAPAAIEKNWQDGFGDAVGENGADAQKRAESAEGIYLWTDFGGQHLRNNGPKDVSVIITAPQVRVKKTDDRDDGDENDKAPFATETTVTLPAGDGKDGVGVDLGSSETVTFAFRIDGENVPADTIFLGGGDAVAKTNPVTITKS